MKYGTQFGTATEDEVRELIEMTDEGLIQAWNWLVEWVTSDTHVTIWDPRTGESGLTTPDTVLAHFKDGTSYRKRRRS